MNKDQIIKLLDEKAAVMLDDMEEAVGKIIRKFHAQGSSTKHKRGATTSQKAKNSGVASATKRKKSAKKTLRSKKKKYGTYVPKKTLRKIARAKNKRPGK